MPNALQEHDFHRRYAGQVAAKAAELAGLEAPLDGLGVAITEATERIFGAIAYGTAIGAPSFVMVNAWTAAGWPVQSILGMLDRIYDHAMVAYEALAAEARS